MPLALSLRAVPSALAERYIDEGWWRDETLGAILQRGLVDAAQQPFTVRSDVHPWSGRIGEVDQAARQLATYLRTRGIGPGDVVLLQLPNWVEAAITYWAAAYVGAVVVPVVHFYGPKEVGYILDVTQPAMVVTADRFGAADHLATYEHQLADRPDTQWLVVNSTAAQLPGRAVEFKTALTGEPLETPLVVDPDAPALIGFTSGTTQNPKGVVHSHRTLGFETRQLTMLAAREPSLTGTPVGHFMGMLSALLLPAVRPKPIHLIDAWKPAQVLKTMLAERIGAAGGATFFLTSLLDHPDFSAEHAALMPYMGLGGAPVPASVTDRAARLGINTYRSYGSTEHPSITGSLASEPAAKRLSTDGHPLLGVELRLDDDGQILTRGPDLFLGYTDPQLTAHAVDADGWYHTGDIGVLDEDGYLTITDRLSDIIIRGGENISAQEIEEQLMLLPGVAEVSVVAGPDARLGEHASAVLRMIPGTPGPSLADVRAHLAAAGVAKQKWPEDLFLVSELPRTASGKVQKFRIRDQVRSGALTPVES